MLKVRFSGTVAQVAGSTQAEIPLPGTRLLGDALAVLEEQFPGVLGGASELQWRHGAARMILAVNGRLVPEESAGAFVLNDSDEITIVAPLGGG